MNVADIAKKARSAGHQLARLTRDDRSRLLTRCAQALLEPSAQERILGANRADVEAAEEAARRGELDPALVKRLHLDPIKLQGLAEGLRQLAEAHDRLGEVQVRRELDQGLVLERVVAPLGVLGVVFESRPDAVPQIAGLALKSGNAVILKGGREARSSNRTLVEVLKEAVHASDVDASVIGLLEERAEVDALLKCDEAIDLIVARGSGAFVRHIMDNTRIPVLGHAEGLCHLYLDRAANPEMASALAVDGKVSYPAACNAIETLLWHGDAVEALDACVVALRERGVELRGCPATVDRHPDLKAATAVDWSTEYGSLVLSIRRVNDLREALEHIAAYGSKHTEVIVTDDPQAADEFLASVDAAGVYHNASSRFADGYRYGLGAEVGISTGKLHARGPVGVEGLLSYRWLLRGQGQVASDYGPGKKAYTHRDLPC